MVTAKHLRTNPSVGRNGRGDRREKEGRERAVRLFWQPEAGGVGVKGDQQAALVKIFEFFLPT